MCKPHTFTFIFHHQILWCHLTFKKANTYKDQHVCTYASKNKRKELKYGIRNTWIHLCTDPFITSKSTQTGTRDNSSADALRSSSVCRSDSFSSSRGSSKHDVNRNISVGYESDKVLLNTNEITMYENSIDKSFSRGNSFVTAAAVSLSGTV